MLYATFDALNLSVRDVSYMSDVRMLQTTSGSFTLWTRCSLSDATSCSRIFPTTSWGCSRRVKVHTVNLFLFELRIQRWKKDLIWLSGSDAEEDDRQLRLYAVDSYVALLRSDCSHLPQCFLQVISWVGTRVYCHRCPDSRLILYVCTSTHI